MSIRSTWVLAILPCVAFPAFGQTASGHVETTLSSPVAASEQNNRTISADTAQRPVVKGRLPNGLRYAILSRQGEESGVALRFRVTGGFLAEHRPGERGLAHLIEHLIFHSPTQKAPNELRRFRQVGFPLAMPEPAGGTTTWRESDYFVVSRTNLSADIDSLLELFREVFSELTFRADALEMQRAEVVQEMSDKRLGNDIYASYIAAIAPGSPTDVIEAQNSDDVPIASVDKIKALYNRLYRPENLTVVLVGDIDAGEVKEMIETRFGNWKGVGKTQARAPVPIFQAKLITPISYSDVKNGRSVAFVTNTSRLQPVSPSRNQQIEAGLMDLISIRAINDRLTLTQNEAGPGKFGVLIENGEQGHRLISLWNNFAPGEWRSAIAGLAALSCDLRTAGFTDAEWAIAKQTIVQELDMYAKDITTSPNFEVARKLSDTLTDGREYVPSEEMFNYAQTWLPTLSAKEGSDWWRRQWAAGIEHTRVEAPELAQFNDPSTAIRTAADDGIQNLECKARP